MFQAVSFVIQSVIQFFKMLDTIMIPGTNFSMWTLCKGMIYMNIIYGFVFTFFKMQREDSVNRAIGHANSAWNKYQFRRSLRSFTKDTFKERDTKWLK